ncbi:MAG: histidine--tRNA ligase [Candidatus Pacebacteria bacterium CG10_big_fil_rev_8_21_14_0_10_42_12]|nr:MAG: histidine--tRNA ligase [Candidatus Pacebacteria bacterium CG10_big_fil_rev_8_21_14_0_10_42_12]
MKNTQKVQNLAGFRDFLPAEKRARDAVQASVIKAFIRFGFEPIETPTLEYASLLLGKYGDEADKLVYSFEDRGGRAVALRYDQTVPSARLLSQYQNELPRLFRRYQIQNVFRADKPQKGRYREFTQCDFDIFGSKDAIADAEILACSYAAFKEVGFGKVELRINDRQTLLSVLSPFATKTVDVFSIIQTVDKLDKKSQSEVIDELVGKGLERSDAGEAISNLQKTNLSENLATIKSLAISLGIPTDSIVFTPTLARGLDYYTGMIFEIVVPEYGSGSCGGGGRYDNLIGDLSGTTVPAVGVAFGFDRMVEAAKELGLLKTDKSTADVVVTVFSPELRQKSAEVARKLRELDCNVVLYPGVDSLGKQLKYADQIGVKFAVIIGEDEAKSGMMTLKNLVSGEQKTVSVDDIPRACV